MIITCLHSSNLVQRRRPTLERVYASDEKFHLGPPHFVPEANRVEPCYKFVFELTFQPEWPAKQVHIEATH